MPRLYPQPGSRPDDLFMWLHFLNHRFKLDREEKRSEAETVSAALCEFCLSASLYGRDHPAPVLPAGEIGEGIPNPDDARMDENRFLNDHSKSCDPWPLFFFGEGDFHCLFEWNFLDGHKLIDPVILADDFVLQALDEGMGYA
jgi:hypothetical protein